MQPKDSIKQTIDHMASHGGLILIGELLKSMNLGQYVNTLKNVHCIDPKYSAR